MELRYRLQRRWFREPLVVLQVGEEEPVLGSLFPNPRTPHPPDVERPVIGCRTVWRDATAEDVMNHAPPGGA